MANGTSKSPRDRQLDGGTVCFTLHDHFPKRFLMINIDEERATMSPYAKTTNGYAELEITNSMKVQYRI